MGLLDDAIREHLDLKRRRGADPAEIERLEREALGPVRRGPEEFGPGDLTSAPDSPYDDPIEFDLDEGDEEDGFEINEPSEFVPPPVRELRDEPLGDQLTPDGGEASRYDEPSNGAASSRDATSPDRPPSTGADETAEYDVAQDLDRERKGDGDDVLEETPEFLQDTPEHDRLWFEQRPPRDFDFDE
jgi:hypothetical protein